MSLDSPCPPSILILLSNYEFTLIHFAFLRLYSEVGSGCLDSFRPAFEGAHQTRVREGRDEGVTGAVGAGTANERKGKKRSPPRPDVSGSDFIG